MKARDRLVGAALGAATLLVPILVVEGTIAALGLSPGAVTGAFLRGSVLGASGLEATLKNAVPLLLCGLAVALGFKAGVFNLGAEGQLVLGAIAATAIGTRLPESIPRPIGVPLALAGGALAGAAWAAAAGWLKRARGAPEVLATILLNFVAIQVSRWCIAIGNPLNESVHTLPQSDPVVEGAQLPALIVGRVEIQTGIFIGLLLALALDLLVGRTRTGLELRLSGSNPGVARATGFSPVRATWIAFLGGGALSGLAGALGVLGVTGRLHGNPGDGAGYTAVAVALVARLRPALVIPSALAFAALETGALAAQRRADVPSALATATEGLLVLAVLAQGPIAARLGARLEEKPA